MATPAALPPSLPQSGRFPSAPGDPLRLDGLLTPEARKIRYAVRRVMEGHVAPRMLERWHADKFDAGTLPALHEGAGVVGGTARGYGCPGLSALSCGVALMECARVDCGTSAVLMIHSNIAMLTIAMFGSEAQKAELLPAMARGECVGAWALTEPGAGSDAASQGCVAEKSAAGGGWVVRGEKRWIGNAPDAGVIVVWARLPKDEGGGLGAFIVRRGAPGLTVEVMQRKIGLRTIRNGAITLRDASAERLPGVKSFADTSALLALSRTMVSFQPAGVALGCYEICREYVLQRRQFDAAIGSMQLAQDKLVRILALAQGCALHAWNLARLHEAGDLSHGQASLVKAHNTRASREAVALARELLGANGMLTDWIVAKHFCDAEAFYSYEGTYDINQLVAGRELLKLNAIRPAATARAKL